MPWMYCFFTVSEVFFKWFARLTKRKKSFDVAKFVTGSY